jgi:hypothetical protein
MQRQRTPDGIRVRHSKSCGIKRGARCNCKPTYQANVWSNADRRRIFSTFKGLSAAKAWRREAQVEIERGTMRAPTSMTLREVSDVWLEGARAGTVRNRKGERYKPSAIRGYERCLRLRILPALGSIRLSDVQRRHVQRFVDDLLADGLDPSTIKNTLNPSRRFTAAPCNASWWRSTPRAAWSCLARRAAETGSPRRRRRARSLPPSRRMTWPFGRPLSTRA